MQNFIYALGYGLCHQLPARSLSGAGYVFPVCARDTGIYIGLAFALLVVLFLHRKHHESGFPPVPVIALCALGFLFMAVDGSTSYLGLRSTTNIIRFLSGFAAGYGAGTIFAPVFNGFFYPQPSDDRVLSSRNNILVWFVMALFVPVLFLLMLSWAGVLSLILTIIAIVAVLTIVNMTLLALLPMFAGKADSRSTVMVMLLWSVCLVIVELVILSVAKFNLLVLTA